MYQITREEFISIFKLHQDAQVPDSTLQQFSKYIIGSYKLHQEILRMRKTEFDIEHKGETIRMRIGLEDMHGYQKFVQGYGDRTGVEVSYLDKGRDRPTPFWTTTRFREQEELHQVMHLAYQPVLNMLIQLSAKYQLEYFIKIDYMNNLLKGGIWGYMKPITLYRPQFMIPLLYMDATGKACQLGDYSIKHVITNNGDIWISPMSEPIKRLVKYAEDLIILEGHKLKD